MYQDHLCLLQEHTLNSRDKKHAFTWCGHSPQNTSRHVCNSKQVKFWSKACVFTFTIFGPGLNINEWQHEISDTDSIRHNVCLIIMEKQNLKKKKVCDLFFLSAHSLSILLTLHSTLLTLRCVSPNCIAQLLFPWDMCAVWLIKTRQQRNLTTPWPRLFFFSQPCYWRRASVPVTSSTANPYVSAEGFHGKENDRKCLGHFPEYNWKKNNKKKTWLAWPWNVTTA